VFTVTNNLDSGAGSLRAAIADAHTGDLITFDVRMRGETITLTSGELLITQSLTIDGLESRITISGNGASRVFDIEGGSTRDTAIGVAIGGLTITGGLASEGGGILNAGFSKLSLLEDVLAGNEALGSAGAAGVQGGTVNGGNGGDGLGGALANEGGLVRLQECTISQNLAEGGAGGAGAAGVTNSSSSGGAGGTGGNGGQGLGGAIYNHGQGVDLLATTFSGNEAFGGAGGAGGAGGQGRNSGGAGGQGGAGGLGAGGAVYDLADSSPVGLDVVRSVLQTNQAIGGAGGQGGAGGAGLVQPQNHLQGSNGGAGGTGGIGGQGVGGGIAESGTQPPTLSVFGSTLSGNQALGGAGGTGGAGGVGCKGAPVSFGALTGAGGGSGAAGGVGGAGGVGQSGAIDVGAASLSLSHSLLSGNLAQGGTGGLGGAGGVGGMSSVSIFGCANSAGSGGAGGAGGAGGDANGGALTDSGGDARIDHSTFLNDQALGGTGAQGGAGGTGGSAPGRSFSFAGHAGAGGSGGNGGTAFGGAVAIDSGPGKVLITQTDFLSDLVQGGAGGAGGVGGNGAHGASQSSPGANGGAGGNGGNGFGGGLAVAGSDVTLIQVSFDGDQALGGAGGAGANGGTGGGSNGGHSPGAAGANGAAGEGIGGAVYIGGGTVDLLAQVTFSADVASTSNPDLFGS
jgi:hypothetical protein